MPRNKLRLWLQALTLLSSATFTLNVVASEVTTLLMTKELCANIDQQREKYLKIQTVNEHREFKQFDVKIKAAQSEGVSQEITVSALIENPSGTRVVRINNQFKTIPKGENFKVNGKIVVTPVVNTNQFSQ